MDSQDTQPVRTPQDSGSKAQASAYAMDACADCALMLAAIQSRLGLLLDPVSDGHAARRPTAYQAFIHSAALDECGSALERLQALVTQYSDGREQIECDMLELRSVLSKARGRP